MTVEELEKQLKSFQSDFESTKKDFTIKLESAKKDAEEWKSVATKKEEELKTFKEKAEAAEKEKEKAYAESRANEDKHFLESLVKEGKITPAMQVTAQKLMESMTSETTVATFDSKDGKKIQHTQRSLFKEFLRSFQKSNAYSILSRAESFSADTPEGGDDTVEFAEIHKDGQIVKAQLDDVDLDKQAKGYQEEMRKVGKDVSYADALIYISKRIKQSTR